MPNTPAASDGEDDDAYYHAQPWWPPVGSVSEAALFKGNPPSGLNRDGTFTLRGDRDDLRARLDRAGITMFLPIQGGLLIGRSHAQKAQDMVDRERDEAAQKLPPPSKAMALRQDYGADTAQGKGEVSAPGAIDGDAPVASGRNNTDSGPVSTAEANAAPISAAGAGRGFSNPANASVHGNYPFAGRSTITDPDVLNLPGLILRANRMPGRQDLTREELLEARRKLAEALQQSTDNRERLNILSGLRSIAEAGGSSGLLTPEEVMGGPGSIEMAIEAGAFGGSKDGISTGIRGPAPRARSPNQPAQPPIKVTEEPSVPPRKAGGVTNPEVEKVAKPDPHPDKTPNQFGLDVIQWKKGPQGTLDRIKELNPENVRKMQSQGLTRKMAEQWRDFYADVARRHANNTTAVHRSTLMQKIIDLME